jgi:hypothetical protein
MRNSGTDLAITLLTCGDTVSDLSRKEFCISFKARRMVLVTRSAVVGDPPGDRVLLAEEGSGDPRRRGPPRRCGSERWLVGVGGPVGIASGALGAVERDGSELE